MASSKKRQSSELVPHVESVLTRWVRPGQRLSLALSGGVDSVALLDILHQLQPRLGFHLSAIYVNHQLSPDAGHWAAFCAELCRERVIPFEAVTVHVARRSRESLEAVAREARYRVLLQQPVDFLALAHHQDDQAETLLLQLLRGAGAKGLSAMPEIRRGAGGEGRGETPILLRPLLDIPRQEIVAYAQPRKLKWVEDESNVNTAFDRNFLRHELLPVLERRFPAYRDTLARASGHLAEAAELLDDLAGLDAQQAVVEGRLRVEVLRGLSDARARNLLRHYLSGLGVPVPSAGRLESILQQLLSSRDDAQVHARLGAFEIRRFRDEVYVQYGLMAPAPELLLHWHSEELLELPGSGGKLVFERVEGQGISLARLEGSEVIIRHRQGGERLRPDCKRPTRTLKHLLQEAAMPPWRRLQLPLLFCGEELVFVPEIGVACGYQAQPGELGVTVRWDAAATLNG